MTANLTITIDERNNVLKVPNSALRYRPLSTTGQNAGANGAGNNRQSGQGGQGGGGGQRRGQQSATPADGQADRITPATSPVLSGQTRLVWVLGSDKKPQPRRIVVGLSDGTATEVVSGNLQEGDVVIIGENISGDAKPQTTQTAPGFGGGQRGGVGGGPVRR